MSESNLKQEIVVIKVKDDIHLVINIGAEYGVKEGDKFLVYHIDDEEMKDPITGESLGFLETVRGTGVAEHVQPKMTTVRSNRREKPRKVVSKSGYGTLALLMGETVEYPEPEIIPFESPCEGDKVKKI
jgi:hypothetical protein